ncbi:hypothetical protein AJ79_02478 [Helicocarpus griseus UAMH5409]|uniref:Uncharacterized protein n=1 Tax=Helicocarpus griseus UAMH5409 TaxID=1447875 RepID=A0A2B7Y2P7_9EURO|nr:hypothetical protein AJ79_02478 [Helicocarpus griseus UAMH5409]
MTIFDRFKCFFPPELLQPSGTHNALSSPRELQERETTNCRLSGLPADIKIQILKCSDILSIRNLLQYLPLSTGSFAQLYHERKRAVLNAMVKERFSWEWSIIAGGDPYVALEPLKEEYFIQIGFVVYARFSEQSFYTEVWMRGEGKKVVRPGFKGPKATRDLQIEKYKAAKSNVWALLKLLEDVQDEIRDKEAILLAEWTEFFGADGKQCWIVPWARKNLYRALLILWKLHLPDTAIPPRVPNPPSTDDRIIAESNPQSEAARSRLTEDEWSILMDFMEATAAQAIQKVEIIKPKNLTPAGKEVWLVFLEGLRIAQAMIFDSLKKDVVYLPSYPDLSNSGRDRLRERFGYS